MPRRNKPIDPHQHMIRVDEVLKLTFGALSVADIFLILHDHEPLAALLVITSGATALCAFWAVVEIERMLRSAGSDTLKSFETSERIVRMLPVYGTLINTTWGAYLLVHAISHAIAHNPGAAMEDLICLAITLWLINRTGRGGRDAARKLVGEKSRALRQKLVDSMPAPSPVTSPAQG